MVCTTCEMDTMALVAMTWPDDPDPKQIWRCGICWRETTVDFQPTVKG